jgi:Mg-chelatase subunit ChlD
MDLKNLDIEFLLDKSGSMVTRDCPGGKTRWEYGQETTLALATYSEKHDPDGITVVPFAGSYKVYEGVTAEKVGQVFKENDPQGSTNTAAVLASRLDAYFARKAQGGAKSVCMLVLTDGAPDDQDAVANVIVAATKKMDADEEIAISFIQIGQDAGASAFLQYLDDGLVAKGAKFDIVDTVKIAEVENFSIEQLIEKAFAD